MTMPFYVSMGAEDRGNPPSRPASVLPLRAQAEPLQWSWKQAEALAESLHSFCASGHGHEEKPSSEWAAVHPGV